VDALYYIVICLFVLVCILLVGVILLQSSQTGGMGTAISGNAFNAAFGGQGADRLLVKITTILAILFMTLAISLNVLSTPGSQGSQSINDNSIMNKNKLDNVIEVPVKINTEKTTNDSL